MNVWRDGEFLPADSTHSDVLTTANLVGWGVFTTFRIWQRQMIWPARHFARLQRDGEKLNLVSRFDADAWHQAAQQLMLQNSIRNGFGRATLLGGLDARWSQNASHNKAQSVLCATNFEVPTAPLRVWFSPFFHDVRRPLCGVKGTSYAPWQWLWQQAQARDCEEALWCESGGDLCEAARSNLFWQRKGEIFTPALSTGCLPGIARAWTLHTAHEQGWNCHEIHAPSAALQDADAIWLCNAVSGPRAVREIVLDNAASTCKSRETSLFWSQSHEPENDFVAQLQGLWQRDLERNVDW